MNKLKVGVYLMTMNSVDFPKVRTRWKDLVIDQSFVNCCDQSCVPGVRSNIPVLFICSFYWCIGSALF